MAAGIETPNQRVVRIGPDEVTVTDQVVVILAKHEMPDWQVARGHRPPAIYFDDKKYLLAEKEPLTGKFAFRYVLHPWPTGKESSPSQFFDYNAEVVAERDADRRSTAFDQIMFVALLPFYPFLGMFWSKDQDLFIRFGYVPRFLSAISMFINFCLGITQGVLICVMLNASARSGKMMIGGAITALTGQNFLPIFGVHVPTGVLDGLLLVSLMADAAMRYTLYLRDEQWYGGFLEWLWPNWASKDK